MSKCEICGKEGFHKMSCPTQKVTIYDDRERYLRDIIEHLRHKEREYRERDVLNENDKLGGYVYLQGMVQDGTISMEKALQIKPLLDDPYTDYEINFTENE